jgi:hypothetical protein
MRGLIKEKPLAVQGAASVKKSKKLLNSILLLVIIAGTIAGLTYYIMYSNKGGAPSSLTVVTATLNVQSVPNGALVIVDGAFKGKSPLKLDLPLGKYEVKLALMNHYDWEAQVQLKKEGEMPILVQLIAIEENP